MSIEIKQGEGWAVGGLDSLGEGYGFRKVRKGLDVASMGINAIVMPPGYKSGRHFHDQQEEIYFLHRGKIAMELGPADGFERVELVEGDFVRVDAATIRCIENIGEGDATYVCMGAKDGYVGRDGRLPEGETGLGR
jgi:mannose-6-phosphate isomerase-like protein (cupin superfamily)